MKTRLALFAVAFACLFLGDSRHADAQQFYPYGGVSGGITGGAVSGTGFWHSTSGALDSTAAWSAGGTVTVGDGTHNVGLSLLGSLQATPPTLAITSATGFGATSANANPGGAASVVAGAGGASVTSGTGGAGATASLVGGAGGASAGGSANANGGNAILGSGAAGTGGGGAAGANGLALIQVGGTTVGSFGQAATDFLALGAVPVAATGTGLRVPVNAGVIISERNIANTGDNNVVTLSNGNFVFGNGSQASLVSALIGGTGAYISTSGQTSSPSVNVAGTTVTITGATTIFNSASGVASADLTAGNWSWASGVAAPTITQAAAASTSGGSGSAGANATHTAQAGQAATGASNNGGAGGNYIFGSGAGGTSGSATAGAAGTIQGQVGPTVVLQQGQAASDFISLGATPVAAAGSVRLTNNPGTILAERNSGNTADIILLSTPNAVDVTLGNWTTSGNINVGSTAGTAFTQTNPGNGTIATQTATGSLGGTFGFEITNSITTGPAWGVLPTYNGATTVAMAKTVTTPLYTQAPLATQSATNGAAGVAMTFKSQDGQPATGASNNGGAGGVLNVSSGVGGTSGSATAGVGGALNLQVGGLTVGGYYATPAVGVSIAHSAAATTVLTTPQATSATSTQYTVQAVCRATTLFTGGATTDTFATLQHFTVRNVAGTLTNVASVTVDTSTQSDSSMSTNALSLSISGTNLNWQITPPALAAGVESCWVTSSAPGPF